MQSRGRHSNSSSRSSSAHQDNGQDQSIANGDEVVQRLKRSINQVTENGFSINELTRAKLTDSDRQVVRLIGQHLNDLGLRKTAEQLFKETNIQIENPVAQRFRANVLNGNWDAVLNDLKALQVHLARPQDYAHMKFIVLEQKYLEELERGHVVEALQTLRMELTPLGVDTNRVHQLSTFLMFGAGEELLYLANWAGSGEQARAKVLARLQAQLPPDVMLPPHRLQGLLRQAVQYQYSRCQLHGATSTVVDDPCALLLDHQCNTSRFPTVIRQVITDHCDEVWCAKFSNSGRYLATSSKDGNVNVYEIDDNQKALKKIRVFTGHENGSSFFDWSPDDRYIAVVGVEDDSDLWIWDVQEGKLHAHMCHTSEDQLSAVAWYPNSSDLVVGGQRGHFYLCDENASVNNSWEGVRIRALAVKKDGETVLAADSHYRIRAYNFRQRTDVTLFKETDPLIYFCLDPSENYALCTIKGQGLHLWDLQTRSLVKRYRGSSHGEFVIVSSFGGQNGDFIATGSEDGKIYIWHRDHEDPVQVLEGHTGVVNAVSWSSADPEILISCGDDGKVLLWTPSHLPSLDSTSLIGAEVLVGRYPSVANSLTTRGTQSLRSAQPASTGHIASTAC